MALATTAEVMPSGRWEVAVIEGPTTALGPDQIAAASAAVAATFLNAAKGPDAAASSLLLGEAIIRALRVADELADDFGDESA